MFHKLKTLAAVTVALGLSFSAVSAEDWAPTKPIKIQVGFGAGGSTDTLSRVLASEIEKNTGWDVVVENRPGGGGVAMLSGLMRAKPDGHTLGIGVTIPIVMQLAARGDSLPFKADTFDYVGTISAAPLAVVTQTDASYSDFVGLVEFAKANGGANVGYDGNAQLMMMQAVNKTHDAGLRPVSFNTTAEVIQALLGGHIDAGFAGGSHVEYIEANRLKMLASATAERHSYAPDSGTLVEQGFPYFVDGYFFVAAPDGLSDEASAALDAAISAAVGSDAIKEATAGMALEAVNIGAQATLDSMVNGAKAAAGLVAAAGE